MAFMLCLRICLGGGGWILEFSVGLAMVEIGWEGAHAVLSERLRRGLTFWFSFVVTSCESVTFPLVSWVRCGT